MRKDKRKIYNGIMIYLLIKLKHALFFMNMQNGLKHLISPQFSYPSGPFFLFLFSIHTRFPLIVQEFKN